MKTLDAIKQRRAVKQYDDTASMTESEFETLMSSVLLSPTSYNIQNWRFVRVKDKALRQQLKEAAWGQAQVTAAAELIILCADTKAWQDRPERYWANADSNTRSILLPMIDAFYAGKEQVQRDEAMRSCGIAAQTLMLAAKAMGYDTSPMVGFDTDSVSRLIKLPEDHLVVMMIAVGKAAAPAHPRGGQLPLKEVLFDNHF